MTRLEAMKYLTSVRYDMREDTRVTSKIVNHNERHNAVSSTNGNTEVMVKKVIGKNNYADLPNR